MVATLGRVAAGAGVVRDAGLGSFFATGAVFGAGFGSGLCVVLAEGFVAVGFARAGDFAAGLVVAGFVEIVLGRVAVVFFVAVVFTGEVVFAVTLGAGSFTAMASDSPLAAGGGVIGLFSFSDTFSGTFSGSFSGSFFGDTTAGSAGSNEGESFCWSTCLSRLTLG